MEYLERLVVIVGMYGVDRKEHAGGLSWDWGVILDWEYGVGMGRN